MLVDSHCHLNFPELKDRIPEVLQTAEEHGVQLLQTICTKLSEFDEVQSIAAANENVFCSVGIHPHEADKEQTTKDELVKLTQRAKVIGIGETGLDYYYEYSDRESQQTQFREHIAASRETGLPLIVHTRDAEEDTVAILKEETARGAFPFLIHCFTGTQFLADEALKLGGYISISGIVTFKKAGELRDVVQTVPVERLLVETDSPFLAPVPYRGKTNEPAYTKHTAEEVARLKSLTLEQLAERTTENFFTLFNRAKPT